MNNLTLVTALFDLGRENLAEGFSRKFDHYLETFKRLLSLDFPMVIFCDDTVEEFVWKHRKPENTKVIKKTLKELKEFPFFKDVQKIRKTSEWKRRASWLESSPQGSLELYNPLVMSKQFFLNDAAIFNYFDTKYFAWIDAGLANTVNLESYFTKDMEPKICAEMDKMLYLGFPYDGKVEVHGFEKKGMNKYAGQETTFVARGGFFGGTRTAISDMNGRYYALLAETLKAGYMGTEESIFTLLCYRHKKDVNVHMIESNGLVYKFFEDIKKNKKTLDFTRDSVALYVLTYNLPKQFALWAESFMAAYPVEFKKYNKYVINNSTDPSVTKEYNELFKKYGFTEYKYDNIGINDGRFAVAKHFDESKHEFMIFFEDDMLLHAPASKPSRLGFCTHYKNVFNNCIDIIRSEGLDYLKLSFDEFYGNNLENWGWYNLPEQKRKEMFPDGDKRTKVFHLGSHNGLPYAVGEYHYCNWPIIFTRKGNKTVFLETEFAHKYEQTWMSMCASLQREGKLKSGTLLATIINHHRAHHYPKEARKENKHY